MKFSSAKALMAFAEAARQGNFAAAARELSVSPSAVAKSAQRLEQRFGVRLFHRTTRRVSLTQEGEALYERCRRVLEELSELEASAAGATSGPTGVLRIEAPITYHRRRLMPVLAALVPEHPALDFDLRLSDRQADIVGSGLDAVIRIGTIGDRHERRQPRRRCRVDEGETLVEAAVAGAGLIQVPDNIARAVEALQTTGGLLQKSRRHWRAGIRARSRVSGAGYPAHPVMPQTTDRSWTYRRKPDEARGIDSNIRGGPPDGATVDAGRRSRVAADTPRPSCRGRRVAARVCTPG